MNASLKTLLQRTTDCLGTFFENPTTLYTSTTGLRLLASNREESLTQGEPKQGVVFSGQRKGQNFETATSSLEEADLLSAIQTMITMAEAKEPSPSNVLLPEQPKKREEKKFHTQVSLPLESIPLEKKFQLCRDLSQYAIKADSSVTNASALYREEHIEEIFVNSEKILHQTLSRVDTIVLLVLMNKTQSTQIWDGESLASGFEGAGLPHSRIDQIIADGKRLLNAPRLPAGFYDCVVEPSVSGMLAHEAFGHGTETDMFIKDRSRGPHYLGKQVGSPLVNMIDFPCLSDKTSLYFFDSEGEESAPTQIIKDGILKQGISDAHSARILDCKKTSNGRRESFDRKIYARMSNTFFEAGSHSVDEMIASIDQGYLIRYPTNGMEDPKQWGIQVEALMAEEILNGKLSGKVFSPVILTGYVPDLLHSVSMASKEFKISTLGMCGKGYKEWVKVHDGGPWLKLKVRLG